jgi:hypothetical protein
MHDVVRQLRHLDLKAKRVNRNAWLHPVQLACGFRSILENAFSRTFSNLAKTFNHLLEQSGRERKFSSRKQLNTSILCSKSPAPVFFIFFEHRVTQTV